MASLSSPPQPHEIRHLRNAIGWTQARLGDFLGCDPATVSRWESGHLTPDVVTSGVLFRLWADVFGPYEGPYAEPLPPLPRHARDQMRELGSTLFAAGVVLFLMKGLDALLPKDED